jgi:hypothetical protein
MVLRAENVLSRNCGGAMVVNGIRKTFMDEVILVVI